jgi:hypothetical protein
MAIRCICTPASPLGVLKSLVVELAAIAMIATFSIVGAQNGDAMAATVTLSPGQNIQSAVNAEPLGTTFSLKPGIYRQQRVTPKSGDSFIGQNGATMNGAKILSGWTQASIRGILYWTKAAGTPLPTPNPGCGGTLPCCVNGYPDCIYVQDLYVNGIEYRHVSSLAYVATRSWYYDYGGTDGGIRNNIYLPADANPNSAEVELGDTTAAFQGNASNIKIEHLFIKKYAAPITAGAIEVEGSNWLIEDNTVTLNHGVGISDGYYGTNVHVLNNVITYNGAVGAGGPGSGGLWQSNTIAYNNTDYINPNYGGAGTKFTGNNVTIAYNIVHNNYGTGLFVDGGGMYDTFDHNISYNNYGCGIRYETSRYGTITYNTVYGNNYPGCAQLVYTGSDHGRINHNTVVDNGQGAIDVVNTVGSRTGTIFRVTDVQVTDNTIWTSSSGRNVIAGLVDRAVPAQPDIYSDPSNFFDYNTYEFSTSVRSSWRWGEAPDPLLPIGWSSWRGSRQDLQGRTMTNIHGADVSLPQ